MLNNEEFLNIIKEFKALKHEAAELNEKAAALENNIKQEMLSREIDNLILDSFKIHYKEYEFEKFDKKAFKEAYNELYSQFARLEKGRRLIIT